MAIQLNVGSGSGGVGQADVSIVAKSLAVSQHTALDFLITNKNSVIYLQEKDLANGDNLIDIPGGTTNRVAGVIIVPDQEADFQAILKSISTAGDPEGFKLAKRSPNLLNFETPALPDGTNARFYLKWAGYGRLDVAVTGDAATDKIAYAAHGLADGTRVKFRPLPLLAGVLPGGIVENQLYYIVNGAAGDFKISNSSGGTAIDLTTNGSNFVLSTADKFKFYWL